MTAKTLFGELQEGELGFLGKEIVRKFFGLKATQRTLDKKRGALEGEIASYRKDRLTLLRRRLLEDGKDYCTYHHGAVPASEILPVYLEGTRGPADHYGGDREYREVHWTCLACREELRDRAASYLRPRVVHVSGWKPEEMRLQFSDGGRPPLPLGTMVMDRSPDPIPEELVREYNIPPDIRLDHNTFELLRR
ncbi:MAG: hypothetical protein HYS89_02240 [Candidatus Colwellbacteria bacterium]|nr:hypothetical protein [Candidatus Colwellbacteria bacterium]